LQRSLASLPQFYFPKPTPEGEEEAKREFTQRVHSCFSKHPNGMAQKPFVEMVNEVS
jgi:hypothetical protein